MKLGLLPWQVESACWKSVMQGGLMQQAMQRLLAASGPLTARMNAGESSVVPAWQALSWLLAGTCLSEADNRQAPLLKAGQKALVHRGLHKCIDHKIAAQYCPVM